MTRAAAVGGEWARHLARRDGVVSRAETLRFGVSPATLHAQVRHGYWLLPAPGVVLAAPGPPTVAQWERIALLHAGPTAALDETSALRRHGLRYLPADPTVRVRVRAPWNRCACGPVSVCRARTAFPVTRRGGLPVVGLAEAVAATCRRLTSLQQVRALVCEAVQRELVGVAELQAAYQRGPRRGSALLRQALDDVAAGCRSAPEAEARALFAADRWIREPVWNAELALTDGTFLACVDAYWEDEGVVHEVDSWAYHAVGPAWEQTQRRRSRLTALGLIVVSSSPRRLRTEGAAVCAEVRAALALGRARGGAAGIVLLRRAAAS